MPSFFLPINWIVTSLILALVVASGCREPEPIVEYEIPKTVPEQLKPGQDRLLAAMIPHGDSTWFFKIQGPEEPVGLVAETFRDFVEGVQFDGDVPDLEDPPTGWRRGGKRGMRYASFDISTEAKQLDLSIIKLARQPNWDAEVQLNVNRWRGQVGLPDLVERWAGATPIDVAGADAPAVWVDLVGKSSAGPPMMSPAMSPTPPAMMPSSAVGPAEQATAKGPAESPVQVAATSPASKSELQFDRPEGWREGRPSAMRMAAFDLGPEDGSAEVTVIQAGGELRDNVARWIREVRGEQTTDAIVDDALAAAQTVQVGGRTGQRFILLDEANEAGTSIDGTIIPLENDFSMFVKMRGPDGVVRAQADAMTQFLDSLEW